MKKIKYILSSLMIMFLTGCYPGEDFGIHVSMQVDEVETGLCSGNVISSYFIYDGNPLVSEVGVCWEETSTDILPTVKKNSKKASNVSSPYIITIEDLKELTSYIVRPYMQVDGFYIYGDSRTFRTDAKSTYLPKFGKLQLVKAELDKLSVTSSITSVPAEYPVSEVGICYTDQSTSNFTSGMSGVNTVKAALNDGKFTVDVAGLNFSTTYRVRAYAKNQAGTTYGNIESFRTLGDEYVPKLGEVTITQNAPTFLEVSCTISEPLKTDSVRAWFEYSRSYNSTLAVEATIKEGKMTARIADLQPSYNYSIVAKAENKFGISSSQHKNVTTNSGEKSKPTVSVPTITNITVDGAHAESKIKIADSNYKALSGGFEYSTSEYMYSVSTIEGKLVNDTILNLDLSGLNENTKYYIKAYVNTELGKISSSQISFTTGERIPTISELVIKKTTKTSVTISAYIRPYDDISKITKAGVQYTNGSNLGIYDKKIDGEIVGDSVNVSLTDLGKDNTYLMRAYAIIGDKHYYGKEKKVATKSDDDYRPAIEDVVASDITMTSLNLSFSYKLIDHTYKISEAGFQYYEFSNSSHVTLGQLYAGTIDGDKVTLMVLNLRANSTYQVRPYVKMDDGTIYYGNTIAVDTKKESDYFEETIVSNLTMTSFKLSSKHKFPSQTYKIKEAGFQYYKSEYPSYVSNGSLCAGNIEDGTISLSLSSLISNSTYQVRSYVKLEDGTVYYGNITSVKTKQASDYTPSFTEIVVSDTTMTSITLSSTYTLINEDYEVEEIGFQYYASGYSSYVDKGELYSCSSNDNNIALKLSELNANTTYQIRPYVKLSNETIYYGKTISVKTKDVEDYIGEVTVSEILIRSAKLKASIKDLPTNYQIIETGFHYYELSGNYIMMEKKTAVELADGNILLDISSLKSSSKHEARAYIKYSLGTSTYTSYGKIAKFTTLSTSVLPSVVCNDITSVTTSSFSIEADLKENHKSYPITEAGFVYIKSTSSSALTLNTNNAVRKPLTVQDGKIKMTVDGLDKNSTYLVRAYVISGDEISYNEKTIKVYTNMDDYKPSMGTLSVEKTNGEYIASCKATVSQVFPIIDSGFVYSTSTSSPTLASNDGVVSAQISESLISNKIAFKKPQTGTTTYYVRAYAKNANGVAYSSYRTVNVTWND